MNAPRAGRETPADGPSLSHRLRERLGRHASAGRIALRGRFGSVSYAALGARIAAVSNALPDVAPGEIVGLIGARSPATVTAFFGIMQAGGCPCLVDPRGSTAALRSRLDAACARSVCIEDGGEAPAPDLAGAGRPLRRLPRLHDAPLPRPPAADGARATADSAPPPRAGTREARASFRESLTPADPAMVQLTSGSTGQARGVLLTHGNLLCNARGVAARTGITPADRLLHLMPLHHTNGVNNQLIVPLLAGATVVLADRFRPEAVEDQIAEYGVTYLTGVPTMYSRMLPHLRDPARRRSLRFLRCGSAPIAANLHRRIEAAFGAPLVVSYGLSEATCTSTMNPPGARRIGSVGTVLPGQRVRLLRPETAEAVPDGAEGEVCIAGGAVMRGYADGSAAAVLRDGWLRSGDLGRFDADGYLFITGRLKDLIVRGGENLSPRAIESVLERHPAVESCCVAAAPHADLGEVPVAFVQPRAGARARAGALGALVAEHLSRAHVPVRIHFVDALPENAVGKVDRAALAKRLRRDARDP